MAHISHRTSAEIIPSPEHHVRVIWMIGTIGFWSEPQVPIESFWYWRLVCRQSGVLRPHWSVRPVVNLHQRTNCSPVYPSHYSIHRTICIPRHQVGDHVTVSCYFNGFLSFYQPVRKWLV